MGKWNDYTTKTALKDNDELMILDTDGKANKRTLMDKVWNYVVDKMTTAVIAKLGTTDKTLIGAVNELNSKTILRSNGIYYYYYSTEADEKMLTLTSVGHINGLLVTDLNRYTNVYAVGGNSGIKQISIGLSEYTQPSKSGNTITIPLRAWSSFFFISDDSSITITES